MAAVVNWQIPVFHVFPFFAPLHRNFLNHALSQCHIQYHHHAEAYRKKHRADVRVLPLRHFRDQLLHHHISMAPAAKLSR